ncbi:MAG: phage tail protein [Lentisphaeria bacterium]|nr:phage tail protein [Lentisphaeria bacterium]
MLGRYGTLKFICTSETVRTFSGLSRSRNIRYAQHDVIYKMPALEFVGFGLYKTKFNMRFDLTLGVSPIACLTRLQAMMDNRMYKWLVVGDEFLGRYVIENIEETHKHYAGDGTLIVAEVSLDLIEWSRGK